MGANRDGAFQGKTISRVLRVAGTGLLLASCALALFAGAGTNHRGNKEAELTENRASTTLLDAMSSGPAGAESPLFAQATGEQSSDPAGSSGNATSVNEMPDEIKAWLSDMKKHVSVDPTDTINVTSLGVPPIPVEIVASAKQAEDEMNADYQTP